MKPKQNEHFPAMMEDQLHAYYKQANCRVLLQNYCFGCFRNNETGIMRAS